MRYSLYKDEFSFNDSETIELLKKYNIGFELPPYSDDEDGFALEEIYIISFRRYCFDYELNKGGAKIELTDFIITEYEKLIQSKLLWSFCEVQTYIDNYDNLKKEFISKYDVNEQLFIEEEITYFNHLINYAEKLPNSIKRKVNFSSKSKIQFLSKAETSHQTDKPNFITEEGYILFKKYLELSEEKSQANYNFIFRKLEEDKHLINPSHLVYIEFIKMKFGIIIEKIKTLKNIGADRTRFYELAKTQIKANKT